MVQSAEARGLSFVAATSNARGPPARDDLVTEAAVARGVSAPAACVAQERHRVGRGDNGLGQAHRAGERHGQHRDAQRLIDRLAHGEIGGHREHSGHLGAADHGHGYLGSGAPRPPVKLERRGAASSTSGDLARVDNDNSRAPGWAPLAASARRGARFAQPPPVG
jgi:hypothetical protein